MNRRKFFKILGAFTVAPSIPLPTPPQKLVAFWSQTTCQSRFYSYEYMKAMEALGDEYFSRMRKGMDETAKLLSK